KLWISHRGAQAPWALARPMPLESPREVSGPMPLLGIRARDGAVWRDDRSSLSKASRQTLVTIPALAGVRAFSRGAGECPGRVAGRAGNVGPAASSGCHAGWQSLAVPPRRK